MYSKKEILNLEKKIRITKEVQEILRHQKKKQKVSMAKIVCNLVLREFGKEYKEFKKDNDKVIKHNKK